MPVNGATVGTGQPPTPLPKFKILEPPDGFEPTTCCLQKSGGQVRATWETSTGHDQDFRDDVYSEVALAPGVLVSFSVRH